MYEHLGGLPSRTFFWGVQLFLKNCVLFSAPAEYDALNRRREVTWSWFGQIEVKQDGGRFFHHIWTPPHQEWHGWGGGGPFGEGGGVRHGEALTGWGVWWVVF